MQSSEILRRLAIGDATLVASVVSPGDHPGTPRLDELTESLIRVAVLVTVDAPQSSYGAAVEGAMRAGATLDDLVATLLATIGTVGVPRVLAAAPRIALAAGYDVDVALEQTATLDR
jgi:4-carboxymuconolactone decarboxylase